jgi:SAM-dependent methyltransferase
MNVETYAARHPKTRPGSILPDTLAAIASQPEGSTILDIGCAEGYTIQWLQRQFPNTRRFIGVELSSTRVEKARQMRVPDADFRVGDAQALPVEDQSIDFIIASQVIEHVPDDRQMLREVSRVLAPGGRFQIDTVYKKKWAWYFYRSPSGWAIDPTHLREYTDIEALVSSFPASLNVTDVRLVKSVRRLNILRPLAFLPDWVRISIPGYYVVYLSGSKD